MSPAPRYGWYGDDFTGATDTLATISRRGHRAFLFLDVPTANQLTAAGPLDAIGIAGGARTYSPDAMRAELPAVGRFFRDQGVSLLHYKCCSTFDSAPEIGNIAVAIEALRPFVENGVVPIVGGQPSLGRYCSFSHLFAAAGEAVYRIDRHPTMSRHPATPMLEADLVRHFAALGMDRVGAIHWPSCTAAAFPDTWAAATAGRPPAVLLDASEASHLEAIGAMLRAEADQGSVLAVGASSVAEAWFGGSPVYDSAEDVHADGPVLAFIGSLSPVTRAQVAASSSYRLIPIAPDDVTGSEARRADVIAAAAADLAAGRHVMVSTAPLEGAAPSVLAQGLAQASAALIDAMVKQSGVRRIAVAGGDTSTSAATALRFWGLSYHGLAARGATICRGRHDDPARDGALLLLKGGQMGDPQIFERFASPQGTQRPQPAEHSH